jgi:hypothetical protein
VQDRQSRDPGQDPAPADHDSPVPRLPRGSGFQLSAQSIIRILMFATLLVGVILLRKPCASSVAGFIDQFETQASADAGAAQGTPSGQDPGQVPGAVVPGTYVRITADMSDEELENALRQAGVGDVEGVGGVVIGDAGVPDAQGAAAPE